MAINKVVYGGNTLIDLTQDTVTADKVLKAYKFHAADGTTQTGTCSYDADTSGATATDSEILEGETAFVKGVEVTGTMKNNGGVSGTISTKEGKYTVPQGYHDGSGSVQIDESEKAKLIATNIREGVTILGVLGTMSGMEGEVAQEKTVVPSASADQTIVPDDGYTCLSSVTVQKIPYVESDNTAGGTTVTIG